MKPNVLFNLMHMNKPKDSCSPHTNPYTKKTEIMTLFNDAGHPKKYSLKNLSHKSYQNDKKNLFSKVQQTWTLYMDNKFYKDHCCSNP